MKRNFDAIRKIEEEQGLISIPTILKLNQYLYKKVRASIPDKIFTLEVDGCVDKKLPIQFIMKKDFDIISAPRCKKERIKRGCMGRPYIFCKDCEHKDTCSFDIPCESRNAYVKDRAIREELGKDDRFWKNGKPKTHFILCKYAKYIYAHGTVKGECQKEKCAFWTGKDCTINLYKE